MDERRRSTRDPTYLPGVIYFNHGRDTLSCVIRDYSYEGARIVIPSSQQVVSVIGWPGHKGHALAAALSHTVKTKSNFGAAVNSFHDFERKPDVS